MSSVCDADFHGCAYPALLRYRKNSAQFFGLVSLLKLLVFQDIAKAATSVSTKYSCA